MEDSANIKTKRFSRTPKPLGVMGNAEMQIMAGTATNRTKGGIVKRRPQLNTRTCRTQMVFRSIETARVRVTKNGSRPNRRQESSERSSHSPLGNRRSQERAPDQPRETPPQNATPTTALHPASIARMSKASERSLEWTNSRVRLGSIIAPAK